MNIMTVLPLTKVCLVSFQMTQHMAGATLYNTNGMLGYGSSSEFSTHDGTCLEMSSWKPNISKK